MNRNYSLMALMVLSAVLFSSPTFGQSDKGIIERADLSTRIYSTWEGAYKFAEERVLKIDGLKDLHVLIYRRSGSEGELLDFALSDTTGTKLELICEANVNVKGVTPVLEGIDMFPTSSATDIIVRWRHPGQGRLRAVEKYLYTAKKFELVTRDELMVRGRERKWSNAEDLQREAMNAAYPRPRHVEASTGNTSGH